MGKVLLTEENKMAAERPLLLEESEDYRETLPVPALEDAESERWLLERQREQFSGTTLMPVYPALPPWTIPHPAWQPNPRLTQDIH